MLHDNKIATSLWHNLKQQYKIAINATFEKQIYCRWWFVLFCFLVAGLYDVVIGRLLLGSTFLQWIQVALLALTKATILILLVGYLQRRRCHIMLWTLISTIGLVCCFCLVNTICFSLYGFGISNKLMTIIGQTNVAEVLEFLPGLWSNIVAALSSLALWLAILLIIGLIVIAPKVFRMALVRMALVISTLLGVCWMAVLIICLRAGRTDLFMSTRIAKTIVRSITERRQLNATIAQLKTFPELSKTTSHQYVANVCMIIGESASKGHLALYGYPLPTTPHMSAMNDEIFVFKDALASSTSTAYNLERILSFMPDSIFDNNWYDYPLLIDVLKAAHYKTYWISNQEKAGVWSNSSYAMISHADVIKYMGNTSSEDYLLERNDGILLPEIAQAFADSTAAKFIGVHLKGSHTIYANRYPAEYNYFSDTDILEFRSPQTWLNTKNAQTVAEYDNSIRYTDYIVSCIIDMARNSSKPSVVLYFSDHGENVYDNKNFCGRDPLFVEVPFIIYVNDPLRASNQSLVNQLGKAVSRPFSTANVIHSIMSLTGTSVSLYNPKSDVLSDSFEIRPRYVDGQSWAKDTR